MNTGSALERTQARDEAISGRFDGDGFLIEPRTWDKRLAQTIADIDGVGLLTVKHWEVINLVRGQYFDMGSLPVMRLICRAAGLDPQDAHKLFSSCRELWRVAGLPNPGEEAKAYMH